MAEPSIAVATAGTVPPSADAAAPPTWRTGRPVSHRLFLLGEGIGASKTPGLHEAEARAQGIWLSYRCLDSLTWGITADDLPEVVAWARADGFSGFNVTHPFKQAIIPALDGLSPRASALGAVNTVVFRDGAAIGHNTDWCGYQKPFRDALPEACTGTVVQLGAGGAGAAVAYATLDLGTPRLIIHDLRADRARDLADRMDACSAPTASRSAPIWASPWPARRGWSTPPRWAWRRIPAAPCRPGCCGPSCGSPRSSTSPSTQNCWSRPERWAAGP